jgi:anti-anti-sigma factor
MQIEDAGVPGIAVAVLEGRLDTATAPAIEGQLLQQLNGQRVVLDMSGVGFVSSAGLRVLLKAAKAAKTSGNGFVLCGLQPAVREVYEISGFDRIIIVHPTRDAAIAALS